MFGGVGLKTRGVREGFRSEVAVGGAKRTIYEARMTAAAEKRFLQVAILLSGACSLSFATLSVVQGADILLRGNFPGQVNLDSHFRYLSGIFLGVLVALYSCVPGIERKGPRFRLLGALVICGGLARLAGLLAGEVPGQGHLIGLGLELLVTPALLLWQTRVARRMAPESGG